MKHKDYKHLVEIRAKDIDTKENKMIVEGKAIAYDSETILFKDGDTEYKEVIKKGAFTDANLKDAFFKYNHSDQTMVMARYKNKTLVFDERDDGVYIKAELANTTAGRDLYELIKRGDIDKMSFAFSIKEETYNQETRTWSVDKIDKIYDVAAVPMPAYEDTEIYARRLEDVETLKAKAMELADLERKQLLENMRKETKAFLEEVKKY